MNIAIITALPEETTAVLQGSRAKKRQTIDGRHTFRCTITGHQVVVVEAGMGLLNAGWAATLVAGEKPDLILSAGFGGGVVPGAGVGDVVMADRVLQWHGESYEEVAVGFYGLNRVAAELGLARGTFVTGEGILNKKELARRLAGISLPVLEMESAAIARVAAVYGIPFLGIRSISDPWNEELSFSVNDFCDGAMRIRLSRVLATIARRPSIVPQLIRLARNSRIAAAGLASGVQRLLQKI